jgi:hypothetical protein
MLNTYLARYRLVAFVWHFGIDSRKALQGGRRAVDIEADSVSMRVADLLVSDSIHRASTFERDRVGNVHRLYRRPFNFPQSHYHLAEGDVRSRIHRSAGASFRQAATTDSLCALRPPTS